VGGEKEINRKDGLQNFKNDGVSKSTGSGTGVRERGTGLEKCERKPVREKDKVGVTEG